MAGETFDVGAWIRGCPRDVAMPPVSQPVQLAGWTKTVRGGGNDRCDYGDHSGLLPFAPPQPPFGLEGPYTAKLADGDVGVEAVLRAALQAGLELGGGEVVTYRNNLNKIVGAAFDTSAAWAVDACWLPLPLADSRGSGSGDAHPAAGGSGGGGALFLDIVKGGEETWVGDPAAHERFMRWGYRFEALCTAQPVADPNHEYNVLLSTRLAAHRLLIGAELDCFDPALHPGSSNGAGAGPAASGPAGEGAQAGEGDAAAAVAAAPPQASWVELKTYRLPGHAGQRRTLHARKHPKWWLQSFLAGVPRLALGGRDDEGVVRRLDVVRSAELPRISAANGAPWSPARVLHCGAALLSWMRQAAEAAPGQHLRFVHEGGRGRDRAAAAGHVRCELVPGGQLPARLRACLGEGAGAHVTSS